jgi:hypothetical protein
MAVQAYKVESNNIVPVLERLIQIYQNLTGESTDEYVGHSLEDGLPNLTKEVTERLTVMLWHWCRDLRKIGQPIGRSPSRILPRKGRGSMGDMQSPMGPALGPWTRRSD